jgi:hypothetical protein
MEQTHDNMIPIFTQGYHSRNTKERIIPISQENGNSGGGGSVLTGNNGHFSTATKNEVKDELFSSGRSSRSSDRDRMTPSPRPNEFLENGGRSSRSRTVSFNDDDTIAR